MHLKKIIGALLFFITLSTPATAQLNYFDSIKNEIKTSQNDTLKIVLYSMLSVADPGESYDSALHYSQEYYQLAKQLNYKLDEAYALDVVGYSMYYLSNPNSLQILLTGVKIAENPQIEKNVLPEKYWNMAVYYDTNALPKNLKRPLNVRLQTLASLYQDIGHVYGNDYGNRQKQLYYYFKAVGVAQTVNDTYSVILNYNTIANVYLILSELDSSLLYAQKAYDLAVSAHLPQLSVHTFQILGSSYFAKKNYPLAVHFAQRSVHDGIKYNTFNVGVVQAKLLLSDFFFIQKNIDSSLYYAKSAYETARQTNSPQSLLSATEALAKLYKSTNTLDSSVKYLQLAYALKDNVYSSEKIKQIQRLDFEEQEKQKEIAASKQKYQNQLRTYLLLGGLLALLVIASILFRSNRNKQKAFALLQKQKNETDIQKSKAEQTLAELKSTQTQLIQSEKMASLGELTAGIAHEIQNPLNFVNNFSEVNRELIEELRGERLKVKGERNEALEEQLLNDIKQNLEKIDHHGKRADSIVKGMLQHSRSSSGQKELTDINALAEEHLRISYHGTRAKDKSFNATVKTDFDKNLDKIAVIPEDIGRVLLNLYNNAFHSMMEKVKLNPHGYQPVISVATYKQNGKLTITVKDNGKGISDKIKDKVFQPFFTTKATGTGTGLGLSISYDIITKEHGGEIKVESKEGEGAEFIVQLPA